MSPIVTDGKDGDGLQLEKVGQTDQIVSQQSTLEGSFCKNLLQIFSCSTKFIPTRKGDRELYL